MFDTRLPKPRGFSGRPLIALLFAVGMGILAYSVGSWFHLNGPTIFVIIVAAVDPLVKALRLAFTTRTGSGFYLRAESFFNVASYVDAIGGSNITTGESL
jgi:predicted ATPase